MEGRLLFEDKVVIVTGGAAGIGAALVRDILSQNARHVTFIDVAKREGEQLQRELMNKYGTLRVMFADCDVSDEKQFRAVFRKVLSKFHRLEVVINNAAVLSNDNSLLRKLIDVNFTAVVNSTLLALDTMSVEKGGFGGIIVNVSSLLALKPSEHLPVYSATKAAVIQFTNSIAISDSNKNSKVRIVTVCLGPTDTAILNKQNSSAFDQGCYLTSRVTDRQKVESAVKGIIDVIKKADNASTWVIAGDNPPLDITVNVTTGLCVNSTHIGYVD